MGEGYSLQPNIKSTGRTVMDLKLNQKKILHHSTSFVIFKHIIFVLKPSLSECMSRVANTDDLNSRCLVAMATCWSEKGLRFKKPRGPLKGMVCDMFPQMTGPASRTGAFTAGESIYKTVLSSKTKPFSGYSHVDPR